jgi:hypothetical protein
MITIIGLRYNYFINACSQQLIEYIFCAYDLLNTPILIILSNTMIRIQKVSFFGGFTFRPIRSLVISEITDLLNVSNNVFSFNELTGAIINTSLFIKTSRHKEKRPVWLFFGKKYFINEIINGMSLSIYDTTLIDTLTDISADVIIIDQEKFTIDEIISHCIGDNEYINAQFSLHLDNGSDRNVYIFTGPSNMGKSYLSHATQFSVYETDKNHVLQDSIEEQVIVSGQRFKFLIDDIISNCSFLNNYIEISLSS